MQVEEATELALVLLACAAIVNLATQVDFLLFFLVLSLTFTTYSNNSSNQSSDHLLKVCIGQNDIIPFSFRNSVTSYASAETVENKTQVEMKICQIQGK